MNLRLERFFDSGDATASLLFVEDIFFCFGLEDSYQKDKVLGETRIPAGEYVVGIRTTGGFHARYSEKFPEIHQGMLQIKDVPGFEYILIHVGNTDENTAGCLLVGETCDSVSITIGRSTQAYKRLYQHVIDAAINGDLVIEVLDRDRRGGDEKNEHI